MKLSVVSKLERDLPHNIFTTGVKWSIVHVNRSRSGTSSRNSKFSLTLSPLHTAWVWSKTRNRRVHCYSSYLVLKGLMKQRSSFHNNVYWPMERFWIKRIMFLNPNMILVPNTYESLETQSSRKQCKCIHLYWPNKNVFWIKRIMFQIPTYNVTSLVCNTSKSLEAPQYWYMYTMIGYTNYDLALHLIIIVFVLPNAVLSNSYISVKRNEIKYNI